MKKRPLCMAVLVIVLVLWLIPAGFWTETPVPAGEGEAGIWAAESPPETLRGQVCRLETREHGQTVYLKHSNISDTGMILVYLNAGQDFSIGNTLLIKQPFELKEPEIPGNPGQFDVYLYYRTQKVAWICYAREAEVIDKAVSRVPEFLHSVRKSLGERCDLLFGKEDGGVLKAMLLGDKTALGLEVKNMYQKSGMSHLLAISGLHVSIAGMSLYRFLRKIGCSYWLAGLPAMGFVLLYGNLTGMSTSTARAVIMFLLAVTADILGKSYDMLTALAVAALLLLAEQPLYARGASFLLSFGAVLGIGFLYPAILSLYFVRSKLFKTLLLSLSVQTMTFPLVQYFYYEFPLYSIALNFVVIPLMSILIAAAILALAVSFVFLPGAWFPVLLCRGILFFYEALGNLTLMLPGSVIICGKPALWQVAAYYLGIVMFVYWRYRVQEREKWKTQEENEGRRRLERRRAWRLRWLCAGGFVLLNACLLVRFHSGLSFTMLDVGQGDGLFLRTDSGTTCLIDGGSTDVSQVGTYRILPCLKSQGVRKLDYIFVTHTDADHISGITELLETAGEPGSIRIGALVMPEQALEEEAGAALAVLAGERGIPVQVFYRGMKLRDAGTEITCLHPAAGSPYEDKNAGSLVLQVVYGEFSLLLAGDLEEKGEQEVLEWLEMKGESAGAGKNAGAEENAGTGNKGMQDFDVLKVGHHGSHTSTSEAWLTAVRPEVALISCGEENSYGHPHRETVARLEAAGSVILTTPECGAITVRSDGKTFVVERFREDKNGVFPWLGNETAKEAF